MYEISQNRSAIRKSRLMQMEDAVYIDKVKANKRKQVKRDIHALPHVVAMRLCKWTVFF